MAPPKKQRKKTKVVIEEHEGKVRAALIVDDNLILDFENDEAPPARIRYGKTSVDELLKNAECWSTKDPRHGGPSGWLDFYAGCRHKEVAKQILDIRKAIKRVEAAMQCVRFAQDAKKKLMPRRRRG